MKITKRQLKRIIKEAQFGRFTGRAAPLDVPMRDSGPVPKDQLRKIADIFINDMGMSPEEVLSKPEFAEQGITDLMQLEEGKMIKATRSHLAKIIQEELGDAPGYADPVLIRYAVSLKQNYAYDRKSGVDILMKAFGLSVDEATGTFKDLEEAGLVMTRGGFDTSGKIMSIEVDEEDIEMYGEKEHMSEGNSMKITKRQLRRIIQERVGGGQYSSEPAHRRGHLGKNIADVEFPILVRYSGKSEVVYDQDALDDLLDYLTRENDIAYSLDSLRDVEASDLPAGRGIERYAESRVLKEYSEYPSWSDISDQMDDITDMLDMLADKYVTSAWLYAGENEGNAISSQIAESLEQLYRDAEKLGALVNSRGKLK